MPDGGHTACVRRAAAFEVSTAWLIATPGTPGTRRVGAVAQASTREGCGRSAALILPALPYLERWSAYVTPDPSPLAPDVFPEVPAPLPPVEIPPPGTPGPDIHSPGPDLPEVPTQPWPSEVPPTPPGPEIRACRMPRIALRT
jgi:hypothetical protein